MTDPVHLSSVMKRVTPLRPIQITPIITDKILSNSEGWFLLSSQQTSNGCDYCKVYMRLMNLDINYDDTCQYTKLILRGTQPG